ncbi:MAG: DUF6249 domain-containing protein [Bacteroidota bacterium]
MELLIPILVPIAFFTMIVLLRKYQNDERIAMIEKGISPGEVSWSQFNGKSQALSSLKFGLLLIGAGLGFLVGYYLDRTFYMDEVGYFSMIFIFGGIGLIISYYFQKRNLEEK